MTTFKVGDKVKILPNGRYSSPMFRGCIGQMATIKIVAGRHLLFLNTPNYPPFKDKLISFDTTEVSPLTKKLIVLPRRKK